jgi:hypothetical protein
MTQVLRRGDYFYGGGFQSPLFCKPCRQSRYRLGKAMYWNGQGVDNGVVPTPYVGVEVNASHFDVYVSSYYVGLCLNVTIQLGLAMTTVIM